MFDKDMAIGFLSGVSGGTATVYVGQPLDTVKVKMQMFPTLYSNAFSCLIKTLRKDGIYRGLYAGTVPALVANVAENSVLFCALEPCKKLIATTLNRSTHELTPLENGYAGAMAAVFSSLVLCPTELVKCKQQALRELIDSGRSTLKLEETGPWKICKNVWSAEGFRGFFHGLVPTFAREVPGYFCFFGMYEFSCYCFLKWGREGRKFKEELSLLETGISGAMAGTALWTMIFPFDVVKSRIQISSGSESSKQAPRQSLPAMLMTIIRNEGFHTLYRGLGPTVLRTIPATGALFIAVEYTRKLMYYISPPTYSSEI